MGISTTKGSLKFKICEHLEVDVARIFLSIYISDRAGLLAPRHVYGTFGLTKKERIFH
jgi:hypothetical protein